MRPNGSAAEPLGVARPVDALRGRGSDLGHGERVAQKVRGLDVDEPGHGSQGRVSLLAREGHVQSGTPADHVSPRVEPLTFREEADHAPLLAALPDGRCQCPHWGYVREGRAVVRYADREEVLEAGDAYYMSPGHVPVVAAGTRIIQFSPEDELAVTEKAIMDAVQAQMAG